MYLNDKEKTDSSVFDLTEKEINKDIEEGNLFFKGIIMLNVSTGLILLLFINKKLNIRNFIYFRRSN